MDPAIRYPLYFGYGSNMWIDQMNRVGCPDNHLVGIARLDNWRWLICETGYANIVESPGDEVWGLVYLISEADEANLDRCEGVPHMYHKQYHMVEYHPPHHPNTKTIEMVNMTYVDVERTKDSKPKEEYIGRMNKAIKDALHMGVPESYIKKYLRPFVPEDDSP